MSCSSITSLPNEILTQIFSYMSYSELERLQAVSKQFLAVASQVMEDRRKQSRLVGFGIKGAQIEGSFIFRIASANKLLKELTIINCEKITSYDLVRVFSVLSNLRKVHLEGEKLYDPKVIEVLGKNNPELRELTIVDRSATESADATPLLKANLYLKKLRVVSVTLPNKELDEENLEIVLTGMTKKLHSFTFHVGSGLTLKQIKIISECAKMLNSCNLTGSLTKKEKQAAFKMLLGKRTDKKIITINELQIVRCSKRLRIPKSS